MMKKVEGESDDRSTRIDRRAAQKLLRSARDPWRRRADQTTDEGDHRALFGDRTRSTLGISQAWTARGRDSQCAQWGQPKGVRLTFLQRGYPGSRKTGKIGARKKNQG